MGYHDSPTSSSYSAFASGSGAVASGSGNRGRDEEGDSFTCDTCGIRRPCLCRYQGSNTCIYCANPGRDEDDEEQACLSCLRVFFRREFQGSSGKQRVYYRSCHRELNQDDDGESVALTPSVADSDFSLSTTSVSSSFNIGRRRPQQTRRHPVSSQPPPVPSPALIPNPPFVEGDLGQPCPNDRDRQLLANWQAEMDNDAMVHYPRCKIKGFGLNLRNGICQSYHRRDVVPTSGHPTRNQPQEGQPFF